jgi:hypothetical protein
MNDSSITIHFDGNGRVYQSGETLAGEYRLHGVRADEIKAIELSILWHTHGKGDEDLAVHHFRRIAPDGESWFGPGTAGRFRTVLPNSPMTYHGLIVKIEWCVRVRAFLGQRGEVVGEKAFRLGRVATARVTSS